MKLEMCTDPCMPSSPSLCFRTPKTRSKRARIRMRIQIQGLNRVNKFIDDEIKREMELENLKLYMENMSILKENEKLRKKASQLHRENLVLLSELEKRFSP